MKSEHDSLVYINSDKDKEMAGAREKVRQKKEKIKRERATNQSMMREMKEKFETQIKNLTEELKKVHEGYQSYKDYSDLELQVQTGMINKLSFKVDEYRD